MSVQLTLLRFEIYFFASACEIIFVEQLCIMCWNEFGKCEWFLLHSVSLTLGKLIYLTIYCNAENKI